MFFYIDNICWALQLHDYIIVFKHSTLGQVTHLINIYRDSVNDYE